MKAKIAVIARRLGKLASNLSQRKQKLLAVIAIVFPFIILGIFLSITKNPEESIDKEQAKRIDVKRVYELSDQECSKSMPEYSVAQPPENNGPASITFLTHRLNCYYEESNYQAALNDAEELNKYYETDQEKQQNSTFIESLKNAIENPPAKSKPHYDGDQLDPEFRESLQKLREDR